MNVRSVSRLYCKRVAICVSILYTDIHTMHSLRLDGLCTKKAMPDWSEPIVTVLFTRQSCGIKHGDRVACMVWRWRWIKWSRHNTHTQPLAFVHLSVYCDDTLSEFRERCKQRVNFVWFYFSHSLERSKLRGVWAKCSPVGSYVYVRHVRRQVRNKLPGSSFSFFFHWIV